MVPPWRRSARPSALPAKGPGKSSTKPCARLGDGASAMATGPRICCGLMTAIRSISRATQGQTRQWVRAVNFNASSRTTPTAPARGPTSPVDASALLAIPAQGPGPASAAWWRVASRFWRLGLEWLTSTRAVVPSGDNDEATVPEAEITAETAPEPSETSSATGPKSDDQQEDVSQGAPRRSQQ